MPRGNQMRAVPSCLPSRRRARIGASTRRVCATASEWRVQPRTAGLWCSVNERDGLGDDLVPDFVTRVREGAFYGWLWFYIGGNEDPRRAGEQPALRTRGACRTCCCSRIRHQWK